ncbi:Gfo/Idh/MocA family oxidoreductase (plasmid) [Streptomyces atratus]|uniref:Predicted dehydrogenase n=1 Tax=Streptomyces atratus TaxID=1893 RepID=A0A1K1ZTC9_STRAR|nr:Gfo/Idh/MocA family oxidoreductase [Streptomyces atratus]SFX77417.1 Predicted dehydrogenase [Streptomyces atratus]
MSAEETHPLRMGVMGCADIAWRRTLPALVADAAIDVTAIASRSLGRATEFTDRFGGVPLAGYDVLLARPDVEAVYIPLPGMLHAEWVERALEAGKHVLAEKPMTASPTLTARLIEVARARGLVLLENYMFLHHSQHAAVREVIDSGVIGEVRGFSSDFTIPPKPDGDIRYQPQVGGGAFLDFGGYPVRAALHFLGGELDVVGAVFRQYGARDVVMSGSVLLCTPQGVPAQLTFGMEHSYRTSYEIRGSEGRLFLDRAFTPPESYQPVLRIERQNHREERVLPADHQFANVIAFFADAVRRDDELRLQQQETLKQAWLIERVEQVATVVKV